MDWDTGEYVWKQVADVIRQRIKDGQYRPRTPIPSEIRLAEELGVAKGTIRKAVAHLREVGVLYTLPQKGTFVSASDGQADPDGDSAAE
ncbi:winged helix-turn-helix domain-containing protein [Streptosporangium sp. NBC_01756]|uniref:winged helix-turn-helix domain-containing protein n=1 Tax=Streptosporangium sp. NBC_01756 TaxID=2975950 RepID=UPI002DD840BD|nr:winged helix-turn-helix domain-containing protein [Streptosporangium sp. NBC_01756]WSC89452.1 winged helix-turn-helix domain-containing protein [Streptosporangium sp. NBC_01756]